MTRPPIASVVLVAIIALFAGAVAACKPPTPAEIEYFATAPSPIPPPLPPLPPLEGTIEVTRILTFEHAIGRSPCPQVVGQISIRRRGGISPGTVRVVSQSEALRVNTGSNTSIVRIDPDAEVLITVLFTCTENQSFEGLIQVIDELTIAGETHDVRVYGSLYR